MSKATATRIGHGLAKALGIKVQVNDPYLDEVTRGESVASMQTTDTYVEEQPTSLEFLSQFVPARKAVVDYVLSLFPFLAWITRYNAQWLIGDLVAGITIGAVVVPQSMAYAGLANLEPQFGLYSSFMGVLIYWFFATSKDITIGPVAVMSTITGNVIADLADKLPEVPAHFVASALAILAGSIVLFIGLIRFGWIVDLIPLTSLSAFMTGSALNIAMGQIPGMMGVKFPKPYTTRDPTYLVFIHFWKYIGSTTLDAAMGLTALAMLYIIRSACSYSAKRFPKHQRLFFFLSTLRTAFVILLYTMISWLVNRHHRHKPLFKILKKVPRGFKNAAVPRLTRHMAKEIAPHLPASVIVLLIEHIAISKSFGRVNNYVINPSQEMVAIGITNVLAPFLGGYPATGSFSRTAIKSKAGVRTPFAGVITAIIVLLAIYALPAVFFYIPNASLAGVIIHAVGDLITPPNTVYRFWRVNPLEVVIFFVGVFVTVFSSIENGIYCTISISAAMLLYRILRSKGRFLGRVKVHSVLGDHVLGDDQKPLVPYGTFKGAANEGPAARNIFIPVDHADGTNPEVEVENPYPGVFIYRFSEGFTYPNASHTLDYMTNYIFRHTHRTNISHYDRLGDRPWNDPGPTRGQMKKAARGDIAALGVDLSLPTLKAIILDFSSVNNIDVTSVQQLIDVRNQLDRYTAPDVVDWHIACIHSRWTKRALASAGFGYPAERGDGLQHRWRSIFSVAELGGEDSAASVAEKETNQKEIERRRSRATHGGDVEAGIQRTASAGDSSDEEIKKSTPEVIQPARRQRAVAVNGLNRPLFHLDLTSALQAAIANVEARNEVRPGTPPTAEAPPPAAASN